MKKISKHALVMYSAKQMYDLVDDIASYSEFLPWCNNSVELSRNDNTVTASLAIKYSGLSKSFTTKNINTAYEKIEMTLVDGPFKHLHGVWRFEPLGDDGTKILLDMEFAFSNRLLDMTVGNVFGHIANSLVDAFIQRAKTVYG